MATHVSRNTTTGRKFGDMTQVQKGVSFGSFYLCKEFLPEKLIFEKLDAEDE